MTNISGDEYQVLGMLAKEHGYDDLYKKCCTAMYENMRTVKKSEMIYSEIHLRHFTEAMDRGATLDQANRIAAIAAVKHTPSEWRKAQ